jgi:hypothetical protein
MAKRTAPEKTAPPKKAATRKVGRSAKTGEFVTKKFAKDHPSTTEVETVKITKPKKKISKKT